MRLWTAIAPALADREAPRVVLRERVRQGVAVLVRHRDRPDGRAVGVVLPDRRTRRLSPNGSLRQDRHARTQPPRPSSRCPVRGFPATCRSRIAGDSAGKGEPLARALVYRNRRPIRVPEGHACCDSAANGSSAPNAHLYEPGGMRRVYLRPHTNILNCLLVQASGFNLGFLMRKVTGVGTPRSLQSRVEALFVALIVLLNGLWRPVACIRPAISPGSPDPARIGRTTWRHQLGPTALRRGHSATGC